jgi:hypothetical protein
MTLLRGVCMRPLLGGSSSSSSSRAAMLIMMLGVVFPKDFLRRLDAIWMGICDLAEEFGLGLEVDFWSWGGKRVPLFAVEGGTSQRTSFDQLGSRSGVGWVCRPYVRLSLWLCREDIECPVSEATGVVTRVEFERETEAEEKRESSER